MSKTYDASNLQVLEGLDPVRIRPGMYIGSTGAKGLHHLLWEIVDNAIDEVMEGYANNIKITLHNDNSISVSDNGRGVPVDIHPVLGITGVEIIYTKLHAGGKFNNDNYSYSGGLHGVGASVVNALSEWMIVDVYREFKHYQIKFETYFDDKEKKQIIGKSKNGLKELSGTRKRGTIVRFKPDIGIFENINFNIEIISRRAKELAYLINGLTIELIDEREIGTPGTTENIRNESYTFSGGINDYIKFLNKDKNTINSEPIFLEDEKDGFILKLAIQFTDNYSENIFSYVNNVPTPEGGTHETGLKTALTKSINESAKKLNLLKDKDDKLVGDDIREGLTAILSIMLKNPQFEGQTKGKLGNPEVRFLVESIAYDKLIIYFENLNNLEVLKSIIDKSQNAAKVREALKKVRDIAKLTNSIDMTPLVGKLSSCTGKNAEKNELFIVEGDSAGGSAKQGRDRHFQAILPLKGKPLNIEKKRLEQVLNNDEFRSIITALGTGIADDFNIANLKYNKIIILSDADQDGAHIRAILLTFFYRYMKELITNGHIYIGMPPLYKVSKGNKVEYAYDDNELKKITSEMGKGYSLQRYKGLGEMNPDQLWQTTMDPKNRQLIQVTIEDAVLSDEIIVTLMGDKVEPRREYIQKHANFIKEDNFVKA